VSEGVQLVIHFDTSADEELTFIHPDDVELYNKWDSKAFELQVANHELLGHGSGKLFEEYEDGKKNFDPEKVERSLYQPAHNSSASYKSGHQPSDRPENVYLSFNSIFYSLIPPSASWYKPGQTPGSVLGEVSSSMEECRAETVALYCGFQSSVFQIYRSAYQVSLVVGNLDILKIFKVGTGTRCKLSNNG